MFYDPVGVLQPIMINFKILFQQICRTKIQWDEEITGDLRQNWDKILNTLENIGKISILRNVVNQDLNDPVDLIELHGFRDASLQNYGASIYIRSISNGGNVFVNLIASKSRLAPMKQKTIPPLEKLFRVYKHYSAFRNTIPRLRNTIPLLQNTIPRSELRGNILFSRLMNSVKNALSKCILISNVISG